MGVRDPLGHHMADIVGELSEEHRDPRLGIDHRPPAGFGSCLGGRSDSNAGRHGPLRAP